MQIFITAICIVSTTYDLRASGYKFRPTLMSLIRNCLVKRKTTTLTSKVIFCCWN